MEKIIFYHPLREFVSQVFVRMGCPVADAALASRALLQADLRGIDSHGVARLSGYVRLWKANRINANPKVRVVHESPSTVVVDGDRGLGLTVAPQAMDLAIKKAQTAGTGWAAIRNSNHFGIAAYHAMKALEHDMIGLAMTNASPLVAPTFAVERMLGTNPICVAIPAGEQPPFVADFATSAAANGKLEILQRKNEEAPTGWIQNKKGEPSANPHELKTGGALLPLGGDRERGGHKGFCLGAWVDIFSAVLSGANYGPWVPPFVDFLAPPANPVGEGIGHFLGAMRIDAFRPSQEFKQQMDRWITRFRQTQTIDGVHAITIPGDPEREFEKERLARGIPLLPKVADDLQQLSSEMNIKLW